MSLSPITNHLSNSYVSASQTPSILSKTIVSENEESRDLEKEDFQARVNRISEEMNRRATTFYGLKFASENILKEKQITTQPVSKNQQYLKQTLPEPFIGYFNKIFSQQEIRIVYGELDPGVDDGSALVQLLAAAKETNKLGKQFEILGIVPCVGNAVLNQTEINTLQFLELTESTDIKVYPGAIAPLAIENNQTAIDEMNQAINQTHFYGYDGEEDIGGWPEVTKNIEKTPGYQYIASQILNASSQAPLTLISTSALTELSKTFSLVEVQSPDSFTNINAISIMGGCLNPPFGCNAPFNLPPDKKTSEANFFFDPPATQHVFEVCRKYRIPILLASLDLTQQPGLLWGDQQVSQLKTIGNRVAAQMAKLTGVIPYLDKLQFPNGMWPNHDLQSVTCLIKPESYSVTRMAVNISSIGEILIDENAIDEEKNVYFLSMNNDQQSGFFGSLLDLYNNFNNLLYSK